MRSPVWLLSGAACIAAAIWFVGWLLAGFSSLGGLASDAFYFYGGQVGVALGILMIPIVFSVGQTKFDAGGKRLRIAFWIGAITSPCLALSAAMVTAGATGLLGDQAPGYVLTLWSVCMLAFFVWVASMTLALNSAGRHRTLWPGVIAIGAPLLLVLVPPAYAVFAPKHIYTDGDFLLALPITLGSWLGIPLWLIALARDLAQSSPPAMAPERSPSHR